MWVDLQLLCLYLSDTEDGSPSRLQIKTEIGSPEVPLTSSHYQLGGEQGMGGGEGVPYTISINRSGSF